MCHILFIQSSVDRQLLGFLLFVTLRLFLWGVYPGEELLHNMGTLCLIFWGPAMLCCTAAASFYIHTKFTKVPVFLQPYQHLFSAFLVVATILMHVRWSSFDLWKDTVSKCSVTTWCITCLSLHFQDLNLVTSWRHMAIIVMVKSVVFSSSFTDPSGPAFSAPGHSKQGGHV